jgi:hypothetical protein
MNYHAIEGRDWRKEQPALDTAVENAIERLLDHKLTLDGFVQEMDRNLCAARILVKKGLMSHTAELNYCTVYGLVIDHYRDAEG